MSSPFVGDELGVDEVDPKDIRDQDDCVLFLTHLPFSPAFVSRGRERDVGAEAVLDGDGAEGFPEWMSVSTRLVSAVERGEWGKGGRAGDVRPVTQQCEMVVCSGMV